MTDTSQFNNEILKLLCADDTDSEEKDNSCLITNNALEADHIELMCKHKFNYAPLFHEVSSQKSDNNLETTHLCINEIKWFLWI